MYKPEKHYSDQKLNYKLGTDVNNVHQKILNIISGNNLILDIGCYEGYLGKILKDKGNTVYGIEVSEEAAKKAASILNKVFVGNIEDDNFIWPEDKFDIIICADVLEHLFDPEILLKKLKNVLKDQGKVIISVPNVANYWIRKELMFGRFNYQNGGLMDKGHIRLLTYDSAVDIIKKAGYEISEFDVKIELPAILYYPNKLLKIIEPIARNIFPKLFGYQFLFVLKKI